MEKKNKKIAVLIPCYNEEKTIVKVIREFYKVLPEATIYVYDNNSTDKSCYLVKKEDCILKSERKQGKGNGVRSMFRDIEADCYLMIDADYTYSTKKAKKMCQLILDGEADMIIGDRLAGGYFDVNTRLFHNFGNKLFRFLINFLFLADIKDVLSGYRAFSRDFVKSFPALSNQFEIEVEMTIFAIQNHFKILSIPVLYQDRIEGSFSKLSTYKDGVKILMTIKKLFKMYKPKVYYGFLSFLSLILSLLFYFFDIDFVLDNKFLGLIFFLISILLFLCGNFLEIISVYFKQSFEMYLRLLRRKHDEE